MALTPDKHVTRDGNDYTEALSNLLPQGIAWPRESGSVLMRVVAGLAQVWGRVELSASQLLEIESDPRTTTLMLGDWERNWGLPDLCYAAPQSLNERRVALVERITIEGAQSRKFFIDFCAKHASAITITEYRPFIVGIDRAGDNRKIGDGTSMKDQFGNPLLNVKGTPVKNGETSEYPYMLGPPENRYYWTVHVGSRGVEWFRAAQSEAGVDPHCRIKAAEDIECILDRWKPAHTWIVYDYSGLTGISDPMYGTP